MGAGNRPHFFLMQPEAKVVKVVQDFLRERGAYVVKIHGGDNPYQAVGIPDILACYRGVFLGLEVKLPGNDVSPKQEAHIRRIIAAGGVGATIWGPRAKALKTVNMILAEIDRMEDG